jgi:hypothetical protein
MSEKNNQQERKKRRGVVQVAAFGQTVQDEADELNGLKF